MSDGLLLGGQKVLEVGESLAAAYCGRLLRQMGAEVMRLEDPSGSAFKELAPFVDDSGESVSAVECSLHQGKQTLITELGSPTASAAMERVLGAGGLLILSSDELGEWRETYAKERLLERYPSALIGEVTMFGESRSATALGGELQAQARGGLMNMIGEPPEAPLRIGGYPAQYSTGLALVSGFALALFQRGATAAGSAFSVSVLETVANIEWKGAVNQQQDGRVVTRGSEGAPAILRARDGFFAFFYRPDDWPRVIEVMGDSRLDAERFSTQPLRDAHRSELLTILNECSSKLSKLEMYQRSQEYGMTTGYMATVSDLLQDRQYLSRHYFEDVEVGGRTGQLPGPPWKVRLTDRSDRTGDSGW